MSIPRSSVGVIRFKSKALVAAAAIAMIAGVTSCSKGGKQSSGVAADAAQKVYIAPGKHDEFYAFLSGGFSGQMSVYGLPSGRLLRVIPVFSVNPENGYGFTEETKQFLTTSRGFVPWDDSHHTFLSETNGMPDGRWIFINSNNTPRIARIDLTTFKTVEMMEIPNTGGNHGSPMGTQNTEYLVASTRFSVPIPQKDVSIKSYKENFKATISFVKVEKESGHMSIGFQILMPGIDYDLAHCGKNESDGWCFLTSYNSEKAHTLLEINASKNDKDMIAAINWKRAEKCIAEGKFSEMTSNYQNNFFDDSTMTTKVTKFTKTKMIDPKVCDGVAYFMPIPKSPHGMDVDPSGEFIIGGGKLASQITAYSYKKMIQAIADKKFDGNIEGIHVLDYASVVAGEVKKPCLGPLHTEFDGKGFGYTSCFVSSEVVKWKLGTWEVVDRMPTYYSLGHIMIPGGNSTKPWGKYLLAMNKITKDRFLPTGPELAQSAQLIDISGNKMEMLLDFPTVGEPHYANGIEASILAKRSQKIYELEKNKHPQVVKNEKDAKVVRQGNVVHVYATVIRSHFTPDNIEGVKQGDTVYFHITNLEQDWDIDHGFAILGGDNS